MKKRTAIGSLVVAGSLLVFVAQNEGYKGQAYIPVKGDRPTIGFGQADGVRMGQRTDPVRALITLENDLEGRKAKLAQLIHVPLTQGEMDAYLDLAYNIGLNNFASSTLLKKLNAKDYEGACREILKWDRFHGRPLASLEARRQREYQECIQ